MNNCLKDEYFIAVDPGRDKTGIAIFSTDGNVKEHYIIKSMNLIETIKKVQAEYKISLLIIGSGTSSKKKIAVLQDNFAELRIIVVDEYRSTDQARKMYFKDNPPQGWRRFIPTSMQVPPVPVDDYAAIVIGKKYLSNNKIKKY